MPVYLLHGFRWPREGLTGIRVRTILHDLEDVSADYIQNPASQFALLESFRKEYPEIMTSLPNLTLLEQYDPEDVSSEAAVCQPYAFVGDRVVTIAGGGPNTIQRPLSGVIHGDSSKVPASHGAKKKPTGEVRGKAMSPSPKSRDTALSVNIEDVMASGPGVTPQAWEALADLRDKIANGEKIGWFVIFNGDPDRLVDDDEEDHSEDEGNTMDEIATQNRTAASSEPKHKQSTDRGRREVPTPMNMPIRKEGEGTPSASARSVTEKSLPPEPPKERVTSRSGGFKKFFGKKEKSRD